MNTRNPGNRNRRILLMIAAAALAGLAGARLAQSQQDQNADAAEIRVLPVQGNIYILVGPGGNITAQVGKQGVLLVDSGTAAMSAKVVAALHALTDKPIRYIVDTHFADDHSGGNENLRKAGVTITGANVAANLTDATEGAAIIAHDNVLARMSAPTGRQAATPTGAWPTVTFSGAEKELYFNDESIQILHQPAAKTDGDSIVYFRRSDVISAGDLFLTTGYPVIDLEKGGSIQGLINGLNTILYIAIPAHEQEDGTLIVPGHGRLCDEADVVEYRDMVVIVRDRVRAMVKKGMTLDQIQAAGPTFEYDPRYGATTGPWTTRMFVEAVYKSLNR
jgi:cyclase